MMYCPSCGEKIHKDAYGFGYGSIGHRGNHSAWSIQQIHCIKCGKKHSVADDWQQYEVKLILPPKPSTKFDLINEMDELYNNTSDNSGDDQ